MMESIGVPLLAIVAMMLAGVVHIIIHEAGHLVFGLASGYKFLSFRVFSLALVKDNGRLRIKRYSVAGTLGQCLMLPPDIPAESLPVVSYNLGGVAMNLLVSVICGAALFFCKGHPVAAVFCSMFVSVGVFLIAMNGIPMIIGGFPNDGLNALKLRKNAVSRKAFVQMLATNAMVQNGIRPRDLDNTFFLRPEEVDFTEPLQINNLMTFAAKLMDSGDLDGSLAINREIIAKAGKIKVMAFESKCEAASILFMRNEADEAKALLTPQEMKQIQAYAKSMTSKQRLLFFFALKADGDRAKAQEIYNHCLAHRDSYMMRGEVEMDLELMAKSCAEAQG